MNKKALVIIMAVVVLVFVAGLVYNIRTQSDNKDPGMQTLSRPTNVEKNSVGTVVTSSKNLKLGEVFSITALSGETGAQKVVIKVDGKVVKTCEKNIKECSATVGPFVKADIGNHKYEVDLTNDAGIVEVYSGDFVVNKQQTDAPETKVVPSQSGTTPAAPSTGTPGTPAAPTTPSSGGNGSASTPTPVVYPKMELDSLISSSVFVEVGQVFSTTISFKKTVAIDEITFYIDGNKFKVCEDSFVCGMVAGPMNNADVGIHAYKIVAHAISDETRVYESSFKVLAPAGQPTPAQPIDSLAPTVKIETSKTIVMADTTVGFKATADDASGIKKISMAFGDKIVKECFSVKECYYVAGPFGNITQDTKMIFGATAIDNVGNSLSTGAQYITIKPAAQIVEPTVAIDSPDEALSASGSSTFTVKVNSGSKQLDYVESYVGGELAKICNGSCSFTIGPFTPWAGTTINYYAKAYFTDGSVTFSPQKSMSILAEPTIAVSIAPNQRSIYSYEDLQISSFVDSQGFDVFTNDIYVNDVKKMSCLDSKCFYDARVSDMLGYEPQSSTVLKYYSKSALSNGKTISSAIGTITVMPGQAPQ